MAFSNPPQQPFPFLRLPADIRSVIYHYALNSNPVCTDRLWYYDQRHRIAIGTGSSFQLLRASKRVYDEATYFLYHLGQFAINFNPQKNPEITNAFVLEPKYIEVVERIRHLQIRLMWNSLDRSRGRDFMQEAESNLRTLCVTLVGFSSLRTIEVKTVSGYYNRAGNPFLLPKEPGFTRVLQPFQELRAIRPDLRIGFRDGDPYHECRDAIGAFKEASRGGYMIVNETKWTKLWRLVGRDLVANASF